MNERKNTPAVVLLSGGMDSTVVAAMASGSGHRVHALTVRYGQRHRIEVDFARRVGEALGVESHTFIDLDLAAFGGSALTGPMDVPKKPRSAGEDPIPVTYVPARNTVFLSLALSLAETLGARDIFIGVSSVDYSGYPDCRPRFIEAFERLANLGTRAADGGPQYRINAPLSSLTKAQTVEAGIELGVDFAMTHTCYDPGPGGAPCRKCDACRLRSKGFAQAGLEDPALAGGRA